jgi:hypothetical protein
VVDLRERQAGASLGHEEVDSRTHRLLAQCPQEARVVYLGRARVVDFWVAFSNVVIIVRRLIREV